MSDNPDEDLWRKHIVPLTGMSRDGMPLSENRAPSPDLEPWVARLVSAKMTNDPNAHVACGMCNDLLYTRVIFNGRWTAMTADGHDSFEHEVLQFGQQSKFMPLSCTGDIMSAGFGLRAGAFHALTGRSAHELTDRIERTDIFGVLADDIKDVFSDEYSPEDWNLALEEALRRYIDRHDPAPPNPVTSAFELAAFADPTQSLGDFAEQHNISLRQLERLVKRDFGLTPRTVMRRARALDMAALICGVADESEEEEILLRYFDQSHLIREFASFFGVTPEKFRARPRPLITLTLEQRQARRLEELDRLKPGEKRPWFRSDY
ncbi:Transcriptional regulator, AraC family [Altererythrobacter epoxidivorans]|uniref:Transcriptional regulator, AraC family n=1 Tax=Altererythrobacter epoxidivorans TaxID=361183 RepID=A0A0M5KZ54_9SPHN|nr:helix-turn-helix domain-containing protein [Altererythrobacter epoxidivorans]ALE17961.1 Transcriptional regulator, AraC family [Altererythrobacter epoxidivorans]